MSEGLQWSFVKYQDNQSCLDLIEGSPVSVFSLLNEVGSELSITAILQCWVISTMVYQSQWVSLAWCCLVCLVGESSESSLRRDGTEGSPGEGAQPQQQHQLGQVQQRASLHCCPLCWQSQLPDTGHGGEEQGM